jgi:hypothetical protein
MFFLVGAFFKGAVESPTAKPILPVTPPPQTGEETLRQHQPDMKFIHQLI